MSVAKEVVHLCVKEDEEVEEIEEEDISQEEVDYILESTN